MLKIAARFENAVPDGWSDTIRALVKPDTWTELGRLHDDRLARYADHPIAAFVRLSAYRVPYFRSDEPADADAAWAYVAAAYPAVHRRALHEMSYLIRRARYPSGKVLMGQRSLVIAAVLRACGTAKRPCRATRSIHPLASRPRRTIPPGHC